MLGWFKKKKKQTDSEEAPEPVVTEVPDKEALDDSVAAEKTSTNSSETLEQQPLQTNGVQGNANHQEQDKEGDQSSSLFKRLSKKLSRTRESLVSQMDLLFLGKKEILL